MRISKVQLRQIIKEELTQVFEGYDMDTGEWRSRPHPLSPEFDAAVLKHTRKHGGAEAIEIAKDAQYRRDQAEHDPQFGLLDLVPDTPTDWAVTGATTVGLSRLDYQVAKDEFNRTLDAALERNRRMHPGTSPHVRANTRIAKQVGRRAFRTSLVKGGLAGLAIDIGTKAAIAYTMASKKGTTFGEEWESQNEAENLPIAWAGGRIRQALGDPVSTPDQAVAMEMAKNRMDRAGWAKPGKVPWSPQQAHAFYNIAQNPNDDLGNREILAALEWGSSEHPGYYAYKYMKPPEGFEGTKEEWRAKAGEGPPMKISGFGGERLEEEIDKTLNSSISNTRYYL